MLSEYSIEPQVEERFDALASTVAASLTSVTYLGRWLGTTVWALAQEA
jgi:hypothetical protein